jgi:DDE superfamily endonuclease
MEDILELYAAPPDPARPVVCLDEYPYALRAAVRDPLPAKPGQVKREDYEYERCGGCSLFMLFDRHAAWRRVTVCEQRTKRELADQLRLLVEELYPAATCIRVVLDNLNTHSLGALYEHFPAERAQAIARKLELHYTPVHGSWLNMIEIEWSVLARQGLGRPLASIARVQAESDAWAARRNAERATIQWRFTTADARKRFRRRYPTTNSDAS